MKDETKARIRSYLPYVGAVLLGLVVLFIIRWGFICTGGEYEADCYFHARLSQEGPKVFCFSRHFPWMSQSIWCDHYSDKEMLFHLILWGIQKVGGWLGADNLHPFHYQVLFFDFLFLALFNLILKYRKVVNPWIYTLLAVCVYPSFTWRMLSLRAYLLVMSMGLGLLWMMMSEKYRASRWRYLYLFLFGFVAAWSYSSPHLLLVILAPCALAEFITDLNWKKLICAPLLFVAGIFAGLVIHPQTPNTLLMFKVQCIDVLKAFFFNLESIPIPGGNEFYAKTIRNAARTGYCYLVMGGLNLLGLILCWKRLFGPGWRNRENIARNMIVMTALLSGICAYWIFRFNEYGFFPQLLLLATLVQELQKMAEENGGWSLWLKHGEKVVFCFTLASLIICGMVNACFPPTGRAVLPALGVAQWFKENKMPPGTNIANVNWSHFPMLYYAMPEYTFTWGMDPAFTWATNKKLLRMMAQLNHQTVRPPQEFAEVFHTRFLYVHFNDPWLSNAFWTAGFALVYENWDGWVYDLKRPQVVRKPSDEMPPLLKQFCISPENTAAQPEK